MLEEYDNSVYHLRRYKLQGIPSESCNLTTEAFKNTFNWLIQEASPFLRQDKERVKMYLGRIITLPQLSEELVSIVRESKEWDLVHGQPTKDSVNVLVARLLMRSKTLQELLGNLRLIRVSVEKVLVPSRDAIAQWKPQSPYPNVRVPYDGMLWVEVAKPRS
jgi:hypothetical protein